jgi:hypothetical protein
VVFHACNSGVREPLRLRRQHSATAYGRHTESTEQRHPFNQRRCCRGCPKCEPEGQRPSRWLRHVSLDNRHQSRLDRRRHFSQIPQLSHFDLLLCAQTGTTTRHSTNTAYDYQDGWTTKLSRRKTTTTRNTNLMMIFPFSSPLLLDVKFFGITLARGFRVIWDKGMDKEKKKENQQRTQLLHIAFSRCLLLFDFCFILILSFCLELWSDGMRISIPPFSCLLLSFIE